MVLVVGFEPTNICVLSAAPLPIGLHKYIKMVGVEGIEPSPHGPKPRILPLYDTPENAKVSYVAIVILN